MIFNVPIEPLDMRYSTQWCKWFEREFNKVGIPNKTIHGAQLTNRITSGSFLDVCGTNYYKASQLQTIAHFFFDNDIKNGDVLFFHDLWYPGIEMLAYMRDGLKRDVKIAGCLHDGTYDKYDFTYKSGMARWAANIETGWFELVDKIFVATEFHKTELLKSRHVNQEKVIVTGFPLYWEEEDNPNKENIIVFPHRLVEEKNPQMFDKLKERLQPSFPDWQFIKTHELNLSKKEYYNLLKRSKISVSFADQEYWGIGMLESLFAGCIPIVPNRLSYKEMYSAPLRWITDENLVKVMAGDTFLKQCVEETKQKQKRKCEQAIPNMLKEIETC